MKTFIKGLHTQNDPVNQPPDTYRNAFNILKDNVGKITNEKGTIDVNLGFTGTVPLFEILGSIAVGTDLVLFICFYNPLFNGVNNIDAPPYTNRQSEIGVLDTFNGANLYKVYITSINDSMYPRNSINKKTGWVYDSLNVLNFNFTYNIDVEIKTFFNNQRVVYFTDNYNVPRRINLDNLPDNTRLKEDISLFFDYLLPVVSYNSTAVTQDGSLLSGKYQFAARYLTNTGNSTSFGLLTNPISIVEDFENLSCENYDGCPPQTETLKSINLNLTHLDSNFKYIELLQITWTGIQNTPNYKIITTIENRGQETIQYKVTGSETAVRTLLSTDVLLDNNYYDKAKHIAQKDNRLLLANLTRTEESYDFQYVANRIILTYETKLLNETSPEQRNITIGGDLNHGFVDTTTSGQISGTYKDPNSCDYVGYKRGEIYSFAFVPIFKNGTKGFAYHIPALDSNVNPFNINFTSVLSNDFSKVLKVYDTGLSYPTEYNSSGLIGNIRHHYIPELSITNDLLCTIGIKALNIELTTEMKSVLQGYMIVRQERNALNKRKKIYQAIGKGLMTVTGANELRIAANLGRTDLYAYWSNDPNSNSSVGQSFSNTQYAKGFANLYAPDLIHNAALAKYGTYIKLTKVQYANPKYTSLGSPSFFTNFGDSGNSSAGDFYNCRKTSFNITDYNDNVKVKIVDYREYSSYNRNQYYDYSPFFENTYITGTPFNVQPGSDISLFKIVNNNNVPCILPKLIFADSTYTNEVVLDINNTTENNPTHYNLGIRAQGNNRVYRRDGSNNLHEIIRFDDELVEIYDVETSGVNIYGKLENAEYVHCGNSFDVNQNQLSFFGGDTYIQKYFLTFNQGLVNSNSNFTIGTCIGFYVESEQNYLLRHYVDDGLQTNTNTMPYFPKYKRIWDIGGTNLPLGILNFPSNNGYSTGYNKQYGFKNTFVKEYAKPFLYEASSNFNNRILYSDLSIEGEQLDSYRVFLPNNYTDLQKHKGEISDMFVLNNRLYAQTPYSLFAGFMNEQTSIATSSGDITLGNGGLFPIPFQELVSIEGGYAGTQSKWANCNTPYGRFIVDNIQKKIFLFSDQLSEISDLGMFTFFEERIKEIGYFPNVENGYVSTYDYENQRWILCDARRANPLTISFKPKENVWVSQHDATFYWMASVGNKVYSKTPFRNVFNQNNKGFRLDAQFDFIINDEPDVTKKFDNLFFQMDCYLESIYQGKDDKTLISYFFTLGNFKYNKDDSLEKSFKVFDSVLNRFEEGIPVNQLLVRRVGSEYRLCIPRTSNNPNINGARNRLNSKYLIVHLAFNADSSGNNCVFDLHSVTYNLRKLYR